MRKNLGLFEEIYKIALCGYNRYAMGSLLDTLVFWRNMLALIFHSHPTGNVIVFFHPHIVTLRIVTSLSVVLETKIANVMFTCPFVCLDDALYQIKIGELDTQIL